jgi:diacylglycerol kinase family enzyme
VAGLERWLAGKPAVLVANPTAQSGRAGDWIRRARAHLDDAGVAHRFIATEPAGATIDSVRHAIDDDGARVVISMGGDGTFAEVAKGILHSGSPASVAMGMIPTGTANDQGKSFGLDAGPGAIERNASVIAAGITIPVDVGRITIEHEDGPPQRDLFFDSFSIGFGAAALITRNRDRDWIGNIPGLGLVYRNHMVYVGAVVQRLLESYVVDIQFDLDVIVDGKKMVYESLLDVIVKNTKIFGGEWVLDPNCEADDGVFEMVPITGRADLVGKLLATFRHSPVNLDDLREIGFEAAEPVPATHFVLTPHDFKTKPPAAQIDGEELVPGTQYRVDVLARALNVIVPRDQAE